MNFIKYNMDMYTRRGITLQKVEKQKTPNVGVTAMEQMCCLVAVSKHKRSKSLSSCLDDQSGWLGWLDF